MSRPAVRVLDARADGLDEPGLRRWARAQAIGASHLSRSYCYPYAAVASHCEPVGVDIEHVATCDRAFADSICTPAERAEWSEVKDFEVFTSVWCSKEALAKALGDAREYDPRRLESPLLWPERRAGRWRAAQLEGRVPLRRLAVLARLATLVVLAPARLQPGEQLPSRGYSRPRGGDRFGERLSEYRSRT